ncbi:ABC transporter permease [Dyadobacter sandarakinus]|uniref:ABC transporter permease n=2 Tax=Dyadobacter sandarakinus TaxID=2747268 RepID=A0ABX7IE61_9BACT|nr:ABC transporter permease [Dyadobacter sandarakinus]
MLQNYFKTAWRNLLRKKLYSILTILGLAIGITFSYLVASFIYQELQVNKLLHAPENQYIIRSEWKNPDLGTDLTTLAPLGEKLRADYPNLVAGFYRYDAITVAVSQGDKHFREDVQTGDSTLLSMYRFPLLHGDANTAMSAPNAVMMTENKALKYFGSTNVVGRTLTLHNFNGGKQAYMVSAVLKNIPVNSVTYLFDKPSEIFIPFGSLEGRADVTDNWDFQYMVSYLQLKKGVNPHDLEKPIQQLLATHASPMVVENLRIYLTPLTEYHRSANNNLIQKMISTLLAVTAFILLMAVVNFVNISIGNASSRLKEIGVRKVLGSEKRQLLFQFLAEAITLAGIACILSVGLYVVSAGAFGEIVGKELPRPGTLLPYALLVPLLFAIVTGLLAGIYPALVLSNIPSVQSMKGLLRSVGEHKAMRRVLLGTQFSIALFVFASAATISQQVHYFLGKNPGFNKEALVSVAVPRDWTPAGVAKSESVRNEFARLNAVNAVSLSYEIPNGNVGRQTGIYNAGRDSAQAVHAQILTTDEKFSETYQINMLAGRFLQNPAQDAKTAEIVINRAAMRSLGYASPAAAVGQQVRLHGFSDPLIIAGVTDNFHFESLHQAIKPLAFLHLRGVNIYRYLTFRLNGNPAGALPELEEKWHTLLPDAPFEYTFLDQTIEKMYVAEIRMQKAARLATVLAIVIVVLGISGMVSLNVARRTREVGIRKVLGASATSVSLLFLREFLIILAIGSALALPLAAFVMTNWLANFNYRIAPDWLTFTCITLGCGGVISLLVWLQTWKAATMNPVKSIKLD